jgi:hypothetical protein
MTAWFTRPLGGSDTVPHDAEPEPTYEQRRKKIIDELLPLTREYQKQCDLHATSENRGTPRFTQALLNAKVAFDNKLGELGELEKQREQAWRAARGGNP